MCKSIVLTDEDRAKLTGRITVELNSINRTNEVRTINQTSFTPVLISAEVCVKDKGVEIRLSWRGTTTEQNSTIQIVVIDFLFKKFLQKYKKSLSEIMGWRDSVLEPIGHNVSNQYRGLVKEVK